MNKENIREHVKKIIRYLANSLLLISILVFLISLGTQGIETYSNQLLWTQLNSMWLVVIMLMLVETYYLQTKKLK